MYKIIYIYKWFYIYIYISILSPYCYEIQSFTDEIDFSIIIT